ncbi:unnamed protein product [Urochloa humidicola]
MGDPGAGEKPKEDPRFELELEFVQCLANPTYIHCIHTAFSFLSSSKTLISAMQWRIQQARNNRLKHILPRPPPEPAPAPAPSQGPAVVPLPPSVPTPVAPPVPAPASSMPTVAAGGASAMSPMQFVGTPGTNMPKTDMRNAMGNRKRKMG